MGAWLAPQRACECICSGAGPSAEVLNILEKQLSRCGPEKLAPVPAPSQPASEISLGLLFAVFVVGILVGALLVLGFGGGAVIDLRRSTGTGHSPGQATPAAAQQLVDTQPTAPGQPVRSGPLTPSAKKALALQNGGAHSHP